MNTLRASVPKIADNRRQSLIPQSKFAVQPSLNLLKQFPDETTSVKSRPSLTSSASAHSLGVTKAKPYIYIYRTGHICVKKIMVMLSRKPE